MKVICLAFAILGGVCHAQGLTHAGAVAEFQAGRWSAAYGSFVELANNGDRDAARIALFMHRYGGELFKTQWAATEDELQAWTRLGAPRNRLDPERVAGDPSAGAPRPLYKARMYPFTRTR